MKAVTFELVINPNPVMAVALNLLTISQMDTLERYKTICQRCGMPMVTRQEIDPKTFQLMPYFACLLCGLVGVPR